MVAVRRESALWIFGVRRESPLWISGWLPAIQRKSKAAILAALQI
jgi:hypothetical protein